MGEDAKLFINQGIRIMVGDKPVGFAKEGMLTCNIEDDGSTKESGAWRVATTKVATRAAVRLAGSWRDEDIGARKATTVQRDQDCER